MAKDNVSTGNAGGAKLWLNSAKQYFVGVYNELKKVHWPGRTQLIAYTGVVLISIAIISGILWVFDWGLSFLMGRLAELFA